MKSSIIPKVLLALFVFLLIAYAMQRDVENKKLGGQLNDWKVAAYPLTFGDDLTGEMYPVTSPAELTWAIRQVKASKPDADLQAIRRELDAKTAEARERLNYTR